MMHSTTYCVLSMWLACFDLRCLHRRTPNLGLLIQRPGTCDYGGFDLATGRSAGRVDPTVKAFDLAVPFLAAYRPLWLGLGTLAVDVLAIVTVVSLLRHRVGPKTFRAVHWATYALWPMALLHALGSGTDAGTTWFRGLAVVCAGAVVAAIGWRLAPSYAGRGWTRQHRRPA